MKGLAAIVFIFFVGSESAYANGPVPNPTKPPADTTDVPNPLKVPGDTIYVVAQPKVPGDTIYVAIQVENQKSLNEINGLQEKVLNNKGDTVSWWLNLIAIVLGFFAFMVPLAGYIAFGRFREIERDAKDASGRIGEIRDNAQREIDKIIKEGNEQIERFKNTTSAPPQSAEKNIADDSSPQPVKLNKKYIAAWIAWPLCVVVADFLFDGWLKTISWIFCAIYFAVLVVGTILRAEKEGTFSERVWRFYKNKTAHIPLLIGGIAWICLRLFGELNMGVLDLLHLVVKLDAGLQFLIIGIFGYLLLYIYSGRK
ncbi:MAG: hypothetical protein OXH16_09215 [Gemmatimonadetes bacterium]|nr:hypothetical protein [Gemmatimonadota bacterium]